MSLDQPSVNGDGAHTTEQAPGRLAPERVEPVSPERAAQLLGLIRERVGSVFLGDPAGIDGILRCVVARGHVLIEDVPGVGKTLLATAFARVLGCTQSRIQLTPDLLPADIIGTTILDPETKAFRLRKGPVFSNVVLADEINRTTPRTQSALLEAMSEASVSIDGTIHRLDQPFIVLATQNPHDFEGTFPLPENQLDRFLMRLSLGYPSAEREADVLELRPSDRPLSELEPVVSRDDLLSIQAAADAVSVDRSLLEYIVEFANHTRRDERFRVGLSTRGALSLAQAARASALLAGRAYATTDDVLDNLMHVGAHRVIPRGRAQSEQVAAARELFDEILQQIPQPA
ncbi:MAG: MoxR family ATPase [Planctomycetota bacterium]